MTCSRVENSVWGRWDLVFRGGRGKCAGNSLWINKIRLELVFRGLQQECAHNPNEVSAFRPELVFRDIPGKLVQRGGQPQRLRLLLLCIALLDPVACGVVRVLGAPLGLRLLPARRLAFRFAASVLTLAYT
jgi:hypothetical protein